MVSLKNIITHILQEHGFEASEREGILYGQKGEELVSLGIYEKSTLANIEEFSSAVAEVRGRHIFCVPGEVGQEAEQLAAQKDIVIWKKEDLEKEIGQALISHISEPETDSLFAELMSAKAPEVEGVEAKPLPMYVETLGSEETQKVVKLRLTLEDVKEISKKTVEGFKYDLELVPHYIFEYLCIYEGKGGEEIKNRGIISVNAYTGKYSAWDNEPEYTNQIDNTHVKLEPKIDEPAAKKVALRGVMETNTEHDEVIVERDHATIIEKTVFSPKEENIVLEKKGLVMVPVWCVEGSHGVMILDGTTGKIISEDYYQESRE